jgi:transcriptional regulator
VLIRPHDDASTDDERWRLFVAGQGFGHFVASGRGRAVPVVVPTQFLMDDDHVLFHLAATNPLFGCLEERSDSLMSVAGDWAYIPGTWKATAGEDPRRGIPTTYYAAVQLIGEASVVTDPDSVAEVLRRQRGELEPDGDYVDPLEHRAKLRAIRGIDFTVKDVRAKFKFGGNVDDPHRDLIAERLRERQAPGDAAALRHLRHEAP